MKPQRPPWGEQAFKLEEYLNKFGEFPKQTESPLGRWLHTQRSTGDLAPERRTWLDENVPGWDRSYQAVWETRAEELRQWVAQTGCLPSVSESTLGRWLGTQRAGRSLSVQRRQWLDEHIPGWDKSNHRPWIQRAKELEAYVSASGSLPPLNDKDLGWWLSNQRKGQGLSSARRAWLDEHIPSWNVATRQEHFSRTVIQIPALRPPKDQQFLNQLPERIKYTQRTQVLGRSIDAIWLEEVAQVLVDASNHLVIAVRGNSLTDEAWALAVDVATPNKVL